MELTFLESSSIFMDSYFRQGNLSGLALSI